MFRKSNGFISRKAVMSTLFAAVLSTSAFAHQPPATGLGQSWPNATDVSVSPHYHVYVFLRDGIRYIQINDLNGTVRGAIAEADHVVLVLPVGVDAQYVTTSQASTQAASAADASTVETIYSDSSTRITASPASSGAVQLNVLTSDTCTAWNCTGISTPITGQ
ncbi:hypothetical protein GCM10007862_06950 [Dyella lipolytica]|uniref:Uncharacterized protein n=1 Tax=Dyella lipolytica TaxID=1867835 RepID=A0ABW8IYH1_9GAMM|nr:hypothetical protein [Dyella lipolytica]GLQ45644.1 hypothetical protein GCM10007862_06950 [Dyella lipolytica]